MNTPKNTVYLSNLSYRRDKNGVKFLCSAFGQVKNIKIVVEPSTNQSRGMAFVEMLDETQARRAIAGLDNQLVDGRTLKAKFATPLKSTSIGRKDLEAVGTKKSSEADFKSKQMIKKARNDAKRKANPLVFKAPSKK